MTYSEEEIKKYLDILDTYRKSKKQKEKVDSHVHQLEEHMGQWVCINCGVSKGYILGKYDMKDFDRLHYQKKSIYHRKYYFDKKVNNISKLIVLDNEEKCELYEKLIILDSNDMKLINKKFNRKRMININYIIKKILEEMGCEKSKNINLKINPKILEVYDNWWGSIKKK